LWFSLSMSADLIVNILILAVILLLSIGFHEYAHARASNKLGDPTPKLQGRLTPNPLAHIDPMGFLLIFIIHFGWGKPVQINPYYYKNPRVDEFLVAVAGPITNIILAIIGIVVLKIYSGNLALVANIQNIFTQFRSQFVFLNIGLALFNLLPIPPLDGWKFIKLIIGQRIQKIEYTLATNPLLLIVIFVLLGQSWILSFIGIWANKFTNALMRAINLLW
jgi:Zn-dependent protease